MGVFDGVLFCSDFDGTMAVKGKISPENAEAIAYFRREGGIFCPTSGRRPHFFHEAPEVFLDGGYYIVLNGSMIMRYGATPEEDAIVWESVIPKELALRFAHDALDLPGVRVISLHREHTPFQIRLPEGTHADIDAADGQYRKIAISHEKGMVNGLCEALEPKYRDVFFFSSSSKKIYEAQLHGADKGSTVLRLKELLGAHTLVTAGDYENDIPMLRAADIGYAVGDALDSVKAAADRVTVPCAEHAIAAIVRELAAERS